MKVFIIILCIMLGLVGLFMSACGGYFVVADLIAANGLGIWTIALPIMLVGMACIWGAIAGLRNTTRTGSKSTTGATDH